MTWHTTLFHPNYTPNPLYEIRGRKVYTTLFHSDYTPNPLYEIR